MFTYGAWQKDDEGKSKDLHRTHCFCLVVMSCLYDLMWSVTRVEGKLKRGNCSVNFVAFPCYVKYYLEYLGLGAGLIMDFLKITPDSKMSKFQNDKFKKDFLNLSYDFKKFRRRILVSAY